MPLLWYHKHGKSEPLQERPHHFAVIQYFIISQKIRSSLYAGIQGQIHSSLSCEETRLLSTPSFGESSHQIVRTKDTVTSLRRNVRAYCALVQISKSMEAYGRVMMMLHVVVKYESLGNCKKSHSNCTIPLLLTSIIDKQLRSYSA